MPTHDIGLRIKEMVWLGGNDVQIEVWSKGVRRGRMLISKGALDWVPHGKTPSQGHSVSWDDFVEYMQLQTRKPRGAKRATKRRVRTR